MRQQKKIEHEKLKGTYLSEFKSIYEDLKKGVTHNYDCNCASCLYHFFKKRSPNSRIDKDNFFLYWLSYQLINIKNNKKLPFLIRNKDIERYWDEILDIYCNTTGIDKAYWGKRMDWPLRTGEHFRIITRYDEKYNIPRLIKAKKDFLYWLPFKISPFITEASRFLEIMKDKTNQELPPAVLLFPDETLIDFYRFIYKSRKICAYITKREKRKDFKYREIMRNCHIKKEDLLIMTEYLEMNKIIKTKDKTIFKSSEWKYWANVYNDRINFIIENLTDMEPFSVLDAKEIMITQGLSGSINTL